MDARRPFLSRSFQWIGLRKASDYALRRGFHAGREEGVAEKRKCVSWREDRKLRGCVNDSIRVCAVVGGAAYVSSYTWTIGSQSVTVPVSGGLGGDTAVVCTTVVIPGGVSSLAVSFSVQYDTSHVFCPECCPGAGGSGCDGCFRVRDTIRVEAPICVLIATPETVCVGEPVFFTVQRGGVSGYGDAGKFYADGGNARISCVADGVESYLFAGGCIPG